MTRYILVSLTSGILFALMDGVINANPLAQRLFEVYGPIAKSSVNAPAGVALDLVYGFALAGIFLLLYKALPGEAGLSKGIGFALLVWFFRVAMGVVSQAMIFNIRVATLAYILVTGLGEMLVLGILYGLTLKPRA